MSLRQKHRVQRPGLPELVALAVILATIAAALAWLNVAAPPALQITAGRILSCDIRLTHYNATDTPPKVYIDYAYTAGIGSYTGHWEGFWPATKSPDALTPDKLGLLKSPGRTITVFYDPANPDHSFLHGPATRLPALYAFAATVTALVATVYIVRIYPSWKRRRG